MSRLSAVCLQPAAPIQEVSLKGESSVFDFLRSRFYFSDVVAGWLGVERTLSPDWVGRAGLELGFGEEGWGREVKPLWGHQGGGCLPRWLQLIPLGAGNVTGAGQRHVRSPSSLDSPRICRSKEFPSAPGLGGGVGSRPQHAAMEKAAPRPAGGRGAGGGGGMSGGCEEGGAWARPQPSSPL